MALFQKFEDGTVTCDGRHHWWGLWFGHRFKSGVCVRCGRSEAYVTTFWAEYDRRVRHRNV